MFADGRCFCNGLFLYALIYPLPLPIGHRIKSAIAEVLALARPDTLNLFLKFCEIEKNHQKKLPDCPTSSQMIDFTIVIVIDLLLSSVF